MTDYPSRAEIAAFTRAAARRPLPSKVARAPSLLSPRPAAPGSKAWNQRGSTPRRAPGDEP